MYKKLIRLLFPLLLIAVAAQGYYLLKSIQAIKAGDEQKVIHTNQLSSLEARLSACKQKIEELNKQLYDKGGQVEEVSLMAEIVERTKKATVTIHTTSPISAYENSVRGEASGVMINKIKGLVMTNAHVARRAGLSNYELRFYDGTILDATLIYYDPWIDVAILQVDTTKLPKETEEAQLSEKEPTINQPIFILGNNEGNSHSTHTGRVSSIEEIIRTRGHYQDLPNGSIAYSLNSVGGSSGSGVFDQQGQIVALNYATNKTYGFGVHLQYLKYILSFIKKDKIPIRKHMGAIITRFPVADMIKYTRLSAQELVACQKQLPKGTQNMLLVVYTLKGSPAENVLEPGDIIWAANKEVIGGNLAKLDILMSTTTTPKLKLDILRKGKIKEVEVKLYDMHEHTITKMVSFGGALFFQSDDRWSNAIAMPARVLTFYQIEKGKSFNISKYFHPDRFYGHITAFDRTPVHNLEDLIALIPHLIAKKNFMMNYTNPHQEKYATLINYSNLDPAPTVYTYDPATKQWTAQIIPL